MCGEGAPGRQVQGQGWFLAGMRLVRGGRRPTPRQEEPGALTVQLHRAEGLLLGLQLREHYSVVPEVGAQHPVLQHTQG